MQLALEMLPDNTDPRLVERLRHDLEQMNQLISDTLELAQGLGPREAEEVDLRDLVDNIVAGYRRGEAAGKLLPLQRRYAGTAAGDCEPAG